MPQSLNQWRYFVQPLILDVGSFSGDVHRLASLQIEIEVRIRVPCRAGNLPDEAELDGRPKPFRVAAPAALYKRLCGTTHEPDGSFVNENLVYAPCHAGPYDVRLTGGNPRAERSRFTIASARARSPASALMSCRDWIMSSHQHINSPNLRQTTHAPCWVRQ